MRNPLPNDPIYRKMYRVHCLGLVLAPSEADFITVIALVTY